MSNNPESLDPSLSMLSEIVNQSREGDHNVGEGEVAVLNSKVNNANNNIEAKNGNTNKDVPSNIDTQLSVETTQFNDSSISDATNTKLDSTITNDNLVIEKKKRGRPSKQSSENQIHLPLLIPPDGQNLLNDMPTNTIVTSTQEKEQQQKTQIATQTPTQPGGPTIKRGRGRPRKYPIEIRPSRPKLPPLYDENGNVIKRKRGRPRKHPEDTGLTEDGLPKIKRPRGRPRKNPMLLNDIVREVQNAANVATAGAGANSSSNNNNNNNNEKILLHALKNVGETSLSNTDNNNTQIGNIQENKIINQDSSSNNSGNTNSNGNNKLPSLSNLTNLPNLSDLPALPGMNGNELSNMGGLNLSGLNGMNMSGLNMGVNGMGMNMSMNINDAMNLNMNMNMNGLNGMNPYGGGQQ